MVKTPFHESVKCCKCIGEAEWHDKQFEGFVACYAYDLGFVSFGNANLVVPGAQVEFGEVSRFAKLVEEIRYQGNWVLVLNSDLVEHSIIDTHPL